MWTKTITLIAHFSVILLAIVLVGTIASKEVNTASLESLKKELKAELNRESINLNTKILSLKENLETYQSTREARAKLYGDRIDTLYNLYKENPSKIEGDGAVVEVSNNNILYLESRINKIASLVDNNNNALQTKVDILESKVKSLEQENRTLKLQQKVVNNNLNNNVVNVQK